MLYRKISAMGTHEQVLEDISGAHGRKRGQTCKNCLLLTDCSRLDARSGPIKTGVRIISYKSLGYRLMRMGETWSMLSI